MNDFVAWPINVGIIVPPCWNHLGARGTHFGTTGHHRGTLGQQVAVWEAHVFEFIEFPGRFWTLRSFPVPLLEVTVIRNGILWPT